MGRAEGLGARGRGGCRGVGAGVYGGWRGRGSGGLGGRGGGEGAGGGGGVGFLRGAQAAGGCAEEAAGADHYGGESRWKKGLCKRRGEVDRCRKLSGQWERNQPITYRYAKWTSRGFIM